MKNQRLTTMVAQNPVIAALSSTALISLAPNVLLLFFPHFASGEGERSRLLSLGQALAAGGLLGDVFLHTIPHAAGGEEVGLWILLGFAIFLTTDMLMRSLGGHSHHDHHSKKPQDDDSNHSHKQSLKASAVLLNLVADAMHNFTDGLAIGASFSSISSDTSSVLSLMKSRGGLATVSIMFHEIPHELGDFAVLVKNGFSKRQAILAQFGTAVAAMVGTCVGILLEEFAGDILIYITAGGFIYLAACTILPELLEEKASIQFRMIQIAFFGAGIAFLYAVSLLESMDGDGHHHHGHNHSHQAHGRAGATEKHNSMPQEHDHHDHDHHPHVDHVAEMDHHHHDHHDHHNHHDHHTHDDHNEL